MQTPHKTTTIIFPKLCFDFEIPHLPFRELIIARVIFEMATFTPAKELFVVRISGLVWSGIEHRALKCIA